MAEPAKQAQTPQPEAARPASLLKERWTQWVALTTTVLAVCAAISALKGGGYSTKTQLQTTKETSAWSYYQAKSIKQHAIEQHRDTLTVLRLDAQTPEAQRLADEGIARAKAEIVRYEKEKADIKAEAEAIKTSEEEFQRHAGAFGLAVMLLQIAIMLSSVGALMKKPIMWVLGLGFGVLGLVYMSNGFLLFF
jgi:hypothetical protein